MKFVTEKRGVEQRKSALGQTRTADLQFRKLLLYPLSYKGMGSNLLFLHKLATTLLFSTKHPVKLVERKLDNNGSAMRA